MLKKTIPFLCSALISITYCAEQQEQQKIDINAISIILLKEKPELAGQLSEMWYRNLGYKSYPDYEKVQEGHTQFIKNHAQDTEYPIMFVAMLKDNPVGMCALRATAWPREGVVAWSDEHHEAQPWVAGAVVDKLYQRNGIFSKLLECACTYAKVKLTAKKAYLIPNEEELATFYEKKGFKTIAKVTCKRNEETEENVSIMCRDL